jgi:hypothetical protein
MNAVKLLPFIQGDHRKLSNHTPKLPKHKAAQKQITVRLR